jgi:hypothetical protein
MTLMPGMGGNACDTGNAADTCKLVDGCNAAGAGLLARNREPAAARIAGCGKVEESKEYVPFNFTKANGESAEFQTTVLAYVPTLPVAVFSIGLLGHSAI